MVVAGEPDFWDQCLWEGSIDGVAEGYRFDAFRNGCTISGNDVGPVGLDGKGRGRWCRFVRVLWDLLGDTFAQVSWGGAVPQVAGPWAAAAGGAGGAAKLMVVRRLAFPRAATLVVRATTVSSRAGSHRPQQPRDQFWKETRIKQSPHL